MQLTDERTQELLASQNLDQLIKEAQESTLAEPKWGQGWKALGLAFYQQKNTDEALKALRKASMLLLKDAEVYQLLGNIAQEQQQIKQAEGYFKHALKLDPQNIGIMNRLGAIYLEDENYSEAISIFKEITSLEPDNFSSHLQLAKAYKLNKEPKKYRLALIQAAKAPPTNEQEDATLTEYWIDSQFTKEGLIYLNSLQKKYPNNKTLPYLQAIIATKAGNRSKAISLLEKADKLDKNNPKIVIKIAHLYSDSNLTKATSILEELLKYHPNHIEALQVTCFMLIDNNKEKDALPYLENLIELKLDKTTYWITGIYRYKIHNIQGAVSAFNHFLSSGGDLKDIITTYTSALIKTNNYKTAIETINKHFRENPRKDSNTEALILNLSSAYYNSGSIDDAIKSINKIIKKDRLSEAIFSNYLFYLLHSDKINIQDLSKEFNRFGNYFEKIITPYTNHKNKPNPNKKIKIGFVSADLYNHAVSYFAKNVFSILKKEDFETCVYYNFSKIDNITEELKELTNHWYQVENLDNLQLVELIRSHNIDILIDLSGHTARNRLAAFAYKPAPIQITAIGCPFTTGLKSMDYTIVRNSIENIDYQQSYWTEKFIVIPEKSSITRPSRRKEATQPPNDLPVKRNGFFTYASLNRFSKINDQALDAWVKILQLNENSKLMLGNVEEAQVPEIVELFYKQGIGADRFILKPRMSLKDYMALFHQIDLMLDTWPYGGGTTTNDAVSMGVPVLSIKSQHPVQTRMNALSRSFGLEQFITNSTEDYIKAAVGWANKLEELQAVRSNLLNRPEAVDKEQSANHLNWNVPLRMAWQRWCDGLPPKTLYVPE